MDDIDNTIYVGNLPWKTTEEDLLALFRDYGPIVDMYIVQDRGTGRSRGYAFIQFERADSVQEAMTRLEGAKFQGRSLFLSTAHPKAAREA